MDPMVVILFILGLVLLVGGAELLVRGASKLALAFGVSPLVVGLTVVAFGTSSPELAVSVQAALKGQADIALGNVVGSNIFNLLFILGVSAVITPLAVAQKLVRVDVPIMIGASILVLVLGWTGNIGRIEGALLFVGIVAYTVFAIRQSRQESKAVQAEYSGEFGDVEAPRGAAAIAVQIALIVGGLLALGLGSRWLVEGAIVFARLAGLSEFVIAVTIVAAGTSLPEVATSILAAVRGERDIAVGNVIGSNIFNILCVLGLSAALSPSGVAINPEALVFDIPIMIATAVLTLPIFLTGYTMYRWDGALFLFYYIVYVVFLILKGENHPDLPLFQNVMLYGVLPLTILTTLGAFVRERLRRGRSA